MNHLEAETLTNRISAVDPALGNLVAEKSGESVVTIASDDLVRIASGLREVGFERLGMVTAVDYGAEFELVYRLHSRTLSSGVFIKTRVAREGARIASLFGLWPAALWQEREVFDLFGIDFDGHPDLRRILLPDDFDGHPLRRDYDDERVIRRPDYI